MIDDGGILLYLNENGSPFILAYLNISLGQVVYYEICSTYMEITNFSTMQHLLNSNH